MILNTAPALDHIEVFSDEARLRQIIVNLAANAIKFTSQGEVTISLQETQRVKNKIWLELVVSDTGIGIDAQQLPHIFDSFRQADGTMVRKFGGSGLGLAIVKQLCQLMNGSVIVASQLNQGTRFTCNFELQYQAKQHNAVNSDTAEEGLINAKVLVVEDNQVNQLVAKRMLEKLGLEVHTADSGATGTNSNCKT